MPSDPADRRAPAVWTKIINLYQQRSHLSPGDPDAMRLGAANETGCVLHALLAEDWVIREITPVVGGPAFARMEKEAGGPADRSAAR